MRLATKIILQFSDAFCGNLFADSEFCTTFAIAISKWCVSSAG